MLAVGRVVIVTTYTNYQTATIPFFTIFDGFAHAKSRGGCCLHQGAYISNVYDQTASFSHIIGGSYRAMQRGEATLQCGKQACPLMRRIDRSSDRFGIYPGMRHVRSEHSWRKHTTSYGMRCRTHLSRKSSRCEHWPSERMHFPALADSEIATKAGKESMSLASDGVV